MPSDIYIGKTVKCQISDKNIKFNMKNTNNFLRKV